MKTSEELEDVLKRLRKNEDKIDQTAITLREYIDLKFKSLDNTLMNMFPVAYDNPNNKFSAIKDGIKITNIELGKNDLNALDRENSLFKPDQLQSASSIPKEEQDENSETNKHLDDKVKVRILL